MRNSVLFATAALSLFLLGGPPAEAGLFGGCGLFGRKCRQASTQYQYSARYAVQSPGAAQGAVYSYSIQERGTFAVPVAPAPTPQAAPNCTNGTCPARPGPTSATPAASPPSGTDPYGFTNWLNATRAAHGLPPVAYDPGLSSWARANNAQQLARGLGHFIMGTARRQNSGMGSFAAVPGMWMASPAHRAALLDPTIRVVGIDGMGQWWTFNAS